MNDKTTQPREQADQRILFEAAFSIINDYRPTWLEGVNEYETLAERQAWDRWKTASASPVAAPEAPMGELIHQLRSITGHGEWSQTDADGATIIKRMPHWADLYQFRTLQVVASTGTAPLVPEVAASEQHSATDPAMYEGMEVTPARDDNRFAAAATTASQSDADKLLAMRADYDRKEGEARGMLMGRATTGSASGVSEADLQAMARSPHNVCRQTEANLRKEIYKLHEIIDSRTTAPSRNAAPLGEITRYDAITKGDSSGYVKFGVSSDGRYVKFDDVCAALTQQSAAQAPIRQVQQAGFPSAWCDVSEAEFDTCTSAKRIVYAAQASHAGADTEQDMAFNDGLREAIDAIEAIDDGNAPEYRACQEAIRELVRPAISAAPEQKEKP